MKRTRPVVAIDGPVGAGKSTVARELARALGFDCLNTGAMYRAVAVAARDQGIDPDAADLERQLAYLLGSVSIRFESGRLLLDGIDISARLGEPDIGDLASRLSTFAPVRDLMRVLQRKIGSQGGIVVEGRDIGTAVFPDAEFKFFLDADVSVRAQRRFAELAAIGVAISLSEVREQLVERDRRDAGRKLAPLRRAEDAIVIDSSRLEVGEVLNQIKNQIQTGAYGKKGLKPA